MLSEKEKMARILRLAKVYGSNVRFFPEDNEGDGDALDNAIKAGEKVELKDNEEFDKQRQRADQEAANAVKARTELNETQGVLDTARSENEQLKEQLATAEAKAAEAGISDTELNEGDYEGTDVAIVKAIKNLNEKIGAKDKRIAELEKKASGYEEQARKDDAIQARNSAYEELLTDLDEEYGADCRNDAVKKFSELSTEGKVPKNNPAKATRIMERCYKDAKAANLEKTKKDKSSLPLDSGSGGGNAPNLSGMNLKKGSLEEVSAQLAAAAGKSG